MKRSRRAVSVALVLGPLAAALVAEAQPAAKIPRIGFLSASAAHAPWNEAFRRGLRDLGALRP